MEAKKKSSDFENRFFDLLEGTIEGIDRKVDKQGVDISTKTKSDAKMSDRITKLENAVFPNQVQTIKDLPKWYRDPSIIKLLTLVAGAAILLISLIAALYGKQLPHLFGAF